MPTGEVFSEEGGLAGVQGTHAETCLGKSTDLHVVEEAVGPGTKMTWPEP